MRRNGLHKTLGALAFLLLPAAVQSQGMGGNAGTSGMETSTSSDVVVVTIDGHAITHSEVEALFVAIARDRFYGKSFDENELDQMRPRHWSNVVSAAVNNWLLDHEIEGSEIAVSDAELANVLDMELEFFLAISRLTREEFNARVRDKSGLTLYRLRAQRNASSLYRDAVRRDRWIAAKFRDDIKVTDEELNDAFERKWRGKTLPAEVRVSHILVTVAGSDSNESKLAARKKIEHVLAEARKPGADFGALARKNSTCASASKGGDLGSIPRHGGAFDAFAESAFALKIGEISDVVETLDGYHIIKLTERIEARAVTLALVEEVIRTGLRKRKIGKARRDYIEKLKSAATIVHADEASSK